MAVGAAEPTKVVVVGAGIAGVAAAEAIRSASPDAEITLISKEDELPYYRLNLTRYLAGEIDEDALPIHPENWYEDAGVRLLRGAEVSTVSLEDQTVGLRRGGKEPFDKLVLTVGADPFVPRLPGVHTDGVTRFRTLVDAKEILERAMAGAKCVCIGGGLLGLETAGALARRGANVTLIEGHGWLLPLQLNQKAGEILQRHVKGLGIDVRTQVLTERIVGDERVRGVALQDGSTVPADLVVVATGIRPSTCLARLAGLHVAQGVIVDDRLVSSHPSVLAAGDVAEHRGTVYGTWAASRSQGRIAGMNAAGLCAEFRCIPRSNTLKVIGLDLFSIGEIEAQDASSEEIDEEIDDRYFRFVFHDSRLVGAILLGDTKLTAAAKKAVEGGTDFSRLLRKRPAAADVREYLAEKGR